MRGSPPHCEQAGLPDRAPPCCAPVCDSWHRPAQPSPAQPTHLCPPPPPARPPAWKKPASSSWRRVHSMPTVTKSVISSPFLAMAAPGREAGRQACVKQQVMSSPMRDMAAAAGRAGREGRWASTHGRQTAGQALKQSAEGNPALSTQATVHHPTHPHPSRLSVSPPQSTPLSAPAGWWPPI